MAAIGSEAGIDEHYPFSHATTKWLVDDISIQNVSDSIKLPVNNVGNKEVSAI